MTELRSRAYASDMSDGWWITVGILVGFAAVVFMGIYAYVKLGIGKPTETPPPED